MAEDGGARSYSRWAIGLGWAFVMLIAVPISIVVLAGMERFGSTTGPGVVASGTATVLGCEHHVLGAPYTCDASVKWQHKVYVEDGPGNVSIRSTEALRGQVEVEQRMCGRNSSVYRCPVFTTGYPTRSGLLLLPFVVVLLGLAVGGVFAMRRLAARITGHRPGAAAPPGNEPGATARPRLRKRRR